MRAPINTRSRAVNWLGGWNFEFPDEAYRLPSTDFNIVAAYYHLAKSTGTWPTMREVAAAAEVVLSTVHYRYHDLSASGYLPRMTKSGPELDAMPWRFGRAPFPREEIHKAPDEPINMEVHQEPEEPQAVFMGRKGPQGKGYMQGPLVAIDKGPTSSRKTKTIVVPAMDFDVFG